MEETVSMGRQECRFRWQLTQRGIVSLLTAISMYMVLIDRVVPPTS